MLEIRKIVKIDYTGQAIPEIAKGMILRFKEELSKKFALEFQQHEINHKSTNNQSILFNSKEIEIVLSSDDDLRIYKVKIKFNSVINSVELELIVDQTISSYTTKEIISKVDNNSKIEKNALPILCEVSVNKNQFDPDIFSVFEKAFRDSDKEVRMAVGWCIYSSPAYWKKGIPFILALIRNDDDDMVKTVLKGPLRMIVKEFIEEIVNSIYTDEVWENAFYVESVNHDSIIDSVLERGEGFDEIIEEVFVRGISSQNSEVRINSAWCVYDFGLKYNRIFWTKLVGLLQKQLEEDEDEMVRSNIKIVLDNISKL